MTTVLVYGAAALIVGGTRWFVPDPAIEAPLAQGVATEPESEARDELSLAA